MGLLWGQASGCRYPSLTHPGISPGPPSEAQETHKGTEALGWKYPGPVASSSQKT